MIDFRQYVTDAEQAYMGTLRSFRLLNEDGAVRMHKKFEKKWAEAMNGVYREMISDIASKITTRMKNKPNPEAEELFGSKEQYILPQNGPEIMQLRPDMLEGVEPPASPSQYAPTQSEMSELKSQVSPDEPIVKTNPYAYIDLEEQPEYIEPNPDVNGAIRNPMVQKRTIDADGKRM